MRRSTLLLLVVIALAHAGTTSAAAAESLSRDEQQFVYELNLARWDPAGFGASVSSRLDGLLPRPPLAPNGFLADSAGFKADEMASAGYFAHQSAVTGLWPNELARDFGYPLPSIFSDNANNIESLAVTPDPLVVLLASGGHQAHLMGTTDFWASHGEVGVGRSGVGSYWVVHTAYASETDTFVTGVAYQDGNSNGRMDDGEGLSGVTITVGNRSTTTNAGGGYSIKTPTGKYQTTAAGQGYNGTSQATIRVDGYNVGVDFVSGVSRPIVRDYQLCMNREPTILGTNGNDTLYGTDGADVIQGLAGNDRIYGLQGNDIICGGGGKDLLVGGSGKDRLNGNWGNDTLKGNWGDDTLKGGRGKDNCLTGETLIGCEA